MSQKTNEQGQKVYEVLSEEYIRLKECELEDLESNYNRTFDHQNKIDELRFHIETLKAEL